MIQLDLPAFESFCASLVIPSKDYGLVPMAMMGSQAFLNREIAAGLEADVHDFVILKGRQLGISTDCDALCLWWPQANAGTQGMLVSDDDDNRDYRRDLLLQMNESLPKGLKRPLRLNNRILASWDNGSRLAFGAAGKRGGSNLGRSRGISFLDADEVGSWPDAQAIGALRASLSETNPQRLYLWNSTARGIGSPFHDMWKMALHAVAQRAVFVAWWRHQGYSVDERTQADIWARYTHYWLSSEERIWVALIESRYGHEITRGQLAWHRWKLAETMGGDDVLMSQEWPSLPEEAFQAFGEKFIGPLLIRRLRLALGSQPRAKGFTYQFMETLDETAEKGVLDADPDGDPMKGLLRVWEEPDAEGAYVVAGHPQFSSSGTARHYVAQVWRVWPDRMVQVAEYVNDSGHMYQFAWLLMHLAGAYRSFIPVYFIMEVGASGSRVLEEIHLVGRYGFGLTPRAKGRIQDFMGSVNHYWYTRPDNYGRRQNLISWKTHANNRPLLLHGLRDTVERGQMDVRSEVLIDSLAALRQGETGNADVIAGTGETGDSMAVCAALAVECWVKSALPDLVSFMPKSTPSPRDPKTVQERLVKGYMGQLLATGGR